MENVLSRVTRNSLPRERGPPGCCDRPIPTPGVQGGPQPRPHLESWPHPGSVLQAPLLESEVRI